MYSSHRSGCKALRFSACTCRFTVLIRNELTGTSRCNGVYETLGEAQDACRYQAERSRDFATFQPHTSTPQGVKEGFGSLAGEQVRGSAS